MKPLSHDVGQVTLDLPEHGQLQLPIAGVATRALAALLDGSLLAIVSSIVVGAAAVLGFDRSFLSAAGILAAGIFPVLLPLAFEARWRGQTPGKRVMHLRVIATDGMPASLGALFLRNVLRLVDFLPFGYCLGLLSVAASQHGQRLGDLVANTLVVREDANALLDLGMTKDLIQQGHSLAGVPEPVLMAAKRLLDPSRTLVPQALAKREMEIAHLVRRFRPDLATQTDHAIWLRLKQAVDE